MPPPSLSPLTDRKQSSTTNIDNNYHDDSPNGKRKSSASAYPENQQSNNAEDHNGKKKRRKVNHACVYCRRSHMTCDLERPCARCVKRDIGHLCHDEPRDPPKRSKSEVGVAEIAPATDMGDGMGNGGMGAYASAANDVSNMSMGTVEGTGNSGGPPLAQPQPVSPVQLRRAVPASNSLATYPQNFDWNNSGVHNQFQDMHHLHPNYMFNNTEVTNEYNLLNDFLSTSLLDDGGLYGNNEEAAQVFMNDPLLATSSINALNSSYQQQPPQQHQIQQPQPTLQPPPQPQANAGEEISRPSSAFPISEQSRNKFYMTAADPAGLSSAEDRLHKLLKAKYDAGMLKPFNYVKGYARLNAYMSKHMSRESQVRILKQLDRFRPKFREAMQSLTDMQLVLVEMWFERSLMEYDRVFASMAIPACCWRRTGEIFRGNREMAELIGVGWEKLRDGKLAIHEVIAEDSLVSYWEKFGAIAFDQSQKAILTSCALKTPAGEAEDGDGGVERGENSNSTGKEGAGGGGERHRKQETIKCCFSFTIRRSTHNIPSLIVGNFLPITPKPIRT
ncbi:Transcription factor [Vermiconidia calcicola]|uniref:Transcription factor n=1 Tax=Vermiconidia calcicola TaxID=1690605 RepID=A0ACC3MM77_9PEZI|nr:Transcription factor [Vermiconidia calcicola]